MCTCLTHTSVKYNMRNLPTILLLFAIAIGLPANAQNNTYAQSFKVSNTLSEDDAYQLVQDWFTQNPCTFTSENSDAKGLSCSNRNKQNADVAFTNTQPLQSTDPYGKKFSARCLAKYAGTGNSSINVMYVEYYLVIEIINKTVTASVSPMKYHHFNKNSFAPQQIYSWQGGVPCGAAGNLHDLVDNMGNDNTSDLLQFLHQDTVRLFAELQKHLSQNNALAAM